MSYLYLAIAIVAEVVATSALKASSEFSKQIPDVPAVFGMTLIISGVAVIHLFSDTVSH